MPDRLAAPGMGAYVDPNRTIVGTDAALHTTRRVRDDLSRRQDGVLVRISLENARKTHIKVVAKWEKKLRPIPSLLTISPIRLKNKTELPPGNPVQFAKR